MRDPFEDVSDPFEDVTEEDVLKKINVADKPPEQPKTNPLAKFPEPPRVNALTGLSEDPYQFPQFKFDRPQEQTEDTVKFRDPFTVKVKGKDVTLTPERVDELENRYFKPIEKYIPFGAAIGATGRADEYERLKKKFDSGTATPADYETKAFFESRQPEPPPETFMGKVVEGAKTLPATVLEYTAGLPLQLLLSGGGRAIEQEALGVPPEQIAKEFGQHALTNAAFGLTGGFPGLREGAGTLKNAALGTAKAYGAVQGAKELGAGLGLDPRGGLPTALRYGDPDLLKENAAELALFGLAEGVSARMKPRDPFAKKPEPTAPPEIPYTPEQRAARVEKLNAEREQAVNEAASQYEASGMDPTKAREQAEKDHAPILYSLTGPLTEKNYVEQKAETDKRVSETPEPPKAETPPPEVMPPTEAPKGEPTGDLQSLKKAFVNAEKVAAGEEPYKPGNKAEHTWDYLTNEAVRVAREEPTRIDTLIDEISAKPRNIEDSDRALLLQRKTDLSNQIKASSKRLNEATTPEAIAAETGNRDKLQEQYNKIRDISPHTGTATGRSLAFLKVMMKEDFSAAKMTADRTAAKGSPLTKEEKADIDKKAARIEEIETKLAEKDDAAAGVKTDEAMKGVERDSTVRRQKAQEDFGNAVEAFRKAAGGLFATGNFTPKAIAAFGNMAKAGVKLGYRTAAEFVDRVAEKFGKRPTPDTEKRLTDSFNAAMQAAQAKRQDRILDAGVKGEFGKIANQSAREALESGIKERDKVVDYVHGILKDVEPNLSRRQVMDAISGYGETTPLNKEQIATELRDIKGQLQQIGKLEDMSKGQAPKKTGMERRTPSDEERGLIKQVNEMKRKGGFEVTDPEAQLKSALDGMKTRMRNEITDKEAEMAANKQNIKNKTKTELDAEAKEIKARLDDVRDRYEQVFGKKEMTDQQRVDAAMKALDKSEAEMKRQMKTGDLFPAKKESKTPETPALAAKRAYVDAIRAERDKLRAAERFDPTKDPQLQAMKKAAQKRIEELKKLKEQYDKGTFTPKPKKQPRPVDAEMEALRIEKARIVDDVREAEAKYKQAHRTRWEKIADGIINARIANVLTSPLVYGKLASAAATRMATQQVKATTGLILSKAFPGLARRAPIEGVTSIREEVAANKRAIVKAFTPGLKEAKQSLTGRSDLEVLHEKKAEDNRGIAGVVGRTHGAVKAPIKRAGYEYTVEKYTNWAEKQGMDSSNEATRALIGEKSYEEGKRWIFMNDNWVAKKWRQLAAPEFDKATGKELPSSMLRRIALKAEIPIVRVPTNIAAETFRHVFGSFVGAGRMADAYTKGIEKLPPERADSIMRQMKDGSLGTALLLMGYYFKDQIGGYYQPGEQRKPDDVKASGMRLFGVDIPRWLLHNPVFEVLQVGATFGHLLEADYRKRGNEGKSIPDAAVHALLGIAEETPFVREMFDIAKFRENPGQIVGQRIKGYVVPQAAQFAARQMDKPPQDSVGDFLKADPIKRKPEGIWENIKEGIPGLRNDLPLRTKVAVEVGHLVSEPPKLGLHGTAKHLEKLQNHDDTVKIARQRLKETGMTPDQIISEYVKHELEAGRKLDSKKITKIQMALAKP